MSRRRSSGLSIGLIVLVLLALSFPTISGSQPDYDLVILNGRVIDPETRTDAVRNLGISNGTIKVITTDKLAGRNLIDARGLVVSPGFIDLHQHGQDDENYRFKAMDGVTTALELEVGTGDVSTRGMHSAKKISNQLRCECRTSRGANGCNA
jgi:N-acyl-D-aspartate/D-glutamate deacylase